MNVDKDVTYIISKLIYVSVTKYSKYTPSTNSYNTN